MNDLVKTADGLTWREWFRRAKKEPNPINWDEVYRMFKERMEWERHHKNE